MAGESVQAEQINTGNVGANPEILLGEAKKKGSIATASIRALMPAVNNIEDEIQLKLRTSQSQNENAKTLSQFRAKLNTVQTNTEIDFSEANFKEATKTALDKVVKFAQNHPQEDSLKLPDGCTARNLIAWPVKEIVKFAGTVRDYIFSKQGEQLSDREIQELEKTLESCQDILDVEKDFSELRDLVDLARKLGVSLPKNSKSNNPYSWKAADLRIIQENVKIKIEELNSFNDRDLFEMDRLQKFRSVLMELMMKMSSDEHRIIEKGFQR